MCEFFESHWRKCKVSASCGNILQEFINFSVNFDLEIIDEFQRVQHNFNVSLFGEKKFCLSCTLAQDAAGEPGVRGDPQGHPREQGSWRNPQIHLQVSLW